jgi:transcriptional regulator with XRE-family HTH domain
MSQAQLSAQIGFSLDQMQRFETGETSIGASTLWKIATVLEVPISFFFEGIEGPAAADKEMRAAILLEREAMELVRAYYALPAGQRKGLMDLAHALRNATK